MKFAASIEYTPDKAKIAEARPAHRVYLTTLLHLFPGASAFDQRAQEYELAYLQSSHPAQVALAEQYAGLPL